MENYKAKCIQIENEYTWSLVIEMEESRTVQKTELDELDASVEEVNAEIEKSEEEIKNIESGLEYVLLRCINIVLMV